MRKFKATALVTLYLGNVDLDADQARRRMHAITPVKASKDGAGEYALTGKPVQFKVGEEFGYDGDIPAAMASAMAHPKTGKTVAEERVEKKAKAAPKAKPKSKPEPDEDQTGEGEGNAASAETGAALTGHPLID